MGQLGVGDSQRTHPLIAPNSVRHGADGHCPRREGLSICHGCTVPALGWGTLRPVTACMGFDCRGKRGCMCAHTCMCTHLHTHTHPQLKSLFPSFSSGTAVLVISAVPFALMKGEQLCFMLGVCV